MNPRPLFLRALCLGAIFFAGGCATPSYNTGFKPADIVATMERVADWQLANPSRHRPTEWTQGAGYTGIMALSNLSTSPRFEAAMVKMGESNEWKLGRRPYHADDHVVGQTYVELYQKRHDPQMIATMRAAFDHILANPKNDNLDFDAKKNPDRTDKWSWCDALFMGPPAWVRLWSVTGERAYLDFAIENWWKTSAYLYDKEERLYFRDSSYFGKTEANGRKIFWSRGNGWVMGGLVRVLQYLPAGHPARARFLEQFREMAGKIVTLQQDDGLWRASLLDPASYPLKETSGSGFYTYALAYGVNEKILDRATYAPAVSKAWAALNACVAPDGKLTHVQPIGADPKKFAEDSTEIYGVGAFLLAGSEVYRLSGGAKSPLAPGTGK